MEDVAEKIIKSVEVNYGSYPLSILDDDRLNLYERMILIVLFSLKNSSGLIEIKKKNLIKLCDVTRPTLDKYLNSLEELNWLKRLGNKIYSIEIPEIIKAKYETGDKNIDLINDRKEMFKSFEKYIGLINSMDARKLETYIDDGMTEKCITEVIKYSVRNAKNNSKNYFYSVLQNLLNNGITKKEEFLKSINKKCDINGTNFSRNNKGEKGKTQKSKKGIDKVFGDFR